jgi:uncharacterized membrane protein
MSQDRSQRPRSAPVRRLARILARILEPAISRQRPARMLLRLALAGFLGVAGVGHFLAPEAFLAQVPPYLPAPRLLVAISGAVELALAAALILLPSRRYAVSLAVLIFFLAVLPGNIAQYTEARDAFGLTTDTARLWRVLLSPLLWIWATAAGDVWPRPSRT